MAVEMDEGFLKQILAIEGKIADADFDELQMKADAIHEQAMERKAAEAALLQFVHDQAYYNQILDTDLGAAVVKGLQSGTVKATPAPMQSTEKLLGEPTDSDVMFERLDEDALLKMFGAKDKAALLHWNNPNHWTRMPVGDLMKLSREAGLDHNAVIKSLAAMQELYDRESVVEGYDPATGKIDVPAFIGSSLMGLFTPRVKESIKAGNDPSAKDYAIDLGSNAIQAVPIGRGVGLALRGARPLARKVATQTANAFFAPVTEEAIDAVAYDPAEHPGRGDFNVGRVALGAGVNLGTPLTIAGAAGMYGRYANERGVGKLTRDIMMGDPYLDFLDRQQGIGATTFGGKALRDEMDEAIMADIIRAMEKNDLQKLSKQQLEEYGEFLATHPDIFGKRYGLLLAYQNALKQSNPELAERIARTFDTRNPSVVTPTRRLGTESERFGLDATGELAYTNKDKPFANTDLNYVDMIEEIGKEHNLPLGATKTSAADLAAEKAAQVKAGGGDYGYPSRPTEFDVKVQEKLDDPNFMAKVNARDPKKNLGAQAGLTYVTNKAGKKDYGPVAKIIDEEAAEDLNELTGGIPQEVMDILADKTITRQWDAGFKPRGNSDILNQAYNIYMAWKKKQKSEEDYTQSSASVSEAKSSSSKGRKAGL